MAELIKRLKDNKVERIAFERGVTQDELVAFVHSLSPRSAARPAATPTSRPVDRRTSASAASTAATSEKQDGIAQRHRRDPAALLERGRVGRSARGRAPRPKGMPDAAGRAPDRRRAGRGRHAEPHRADGADRDAELRQLHVHAHGERVDPDDGAGARARHRRPAAARVRPVGADARHRQGAHAEGDPQQARQADRRRVRDHAPARRRRRRDPPPHAGDADPRAGGRLRAPPAARRHRLSRSASSASR